MNSILDSKDCFSNYLKRSDLFSEINGNTNQLEK